MSGDLYRSPVREGGTWEESGDRTAARPHWSRLMEVLEQLGPAELERRWARAERRIRENGITYNIYGDPLGANRPWQIDIVPLLLGAEEWRTIEAGVIQRAELLTLLLQDLYGPQALLKEGRFPAALLFGNPAFLRPLVGMPVPPHSYLHMLAVDLARSPDGQWWVLADRTQAPSGSGYALENRTIVSDVLPELFTQSNVLRLAPFFRSQREALIRLSPRDNPRIVLLTPGPYNETYFEQSYLAKYLDVTLVEGADLTVRNRRVYLKTVGGLEEVDVILRRVDDSYCDPLELRGESLLGVSGLVDAVAAGNVVVANALGSGLIESAAIMPFLPGLAHHLLGQELKLPSVATWWCGQERALDWVLRNLEHVVLKPAFPVKGMEPVFGAELAPDAREQLVERLRARPQEYVAQEQVALSTAPVWEGGSLQQRSVVLRTYVLNTGSGWIAIPGGLVRVAEKQGSVVSMQRGGHSKDAWVLWDGGIDTFSMLRPRDEPVTLRRVSSVVPSRVADNTFWLGRYVERAENLARILRTLLPRVQRAQAVELPSLMRLHGCMGMRYGKGSPIKRRPTTFPAFEKDLLSILSQAERRRSLPSTLAEIFRIGGNVRERLSADMMLLIGRLHHAIDAAPGMPLMDHQTLLTECLELLSAFSGIERENVIRSSGWLFLGLGRRLERAINLTSQLREITRPLDPDHWSFLERLLEVGDSSMTYRARYYTTLQPLPVLDVLMADETNPRSLHFQMAHIADLYRKLPRHDAGDLAAMEKVLADLRSVRLQAIQFPRSGEPVPPSLRQLHRFLGTLEDLLPAWSNAVSSRYFSHARTLPVTVGS